MAKAAAATVLLGLLLATSASQAAPKHDDDRVVWVGGDAIQIRDDDDGPVVVRMGPRRYIGLRLIDVTEELRELWGAPRDAGVLVAEVEKDSPAGKAGVRAGDVIVKADGEKIESAMDLTRAVRRKEKGETLSLEIRRASKAQTLAVAVEERPGRGGEIDLGDLGRDIRREVRRNVHPRVRAWAGDGGHGYAFGFPGMKELDERLEALEKRLSEMEKRLPK